MNAQNEAYGLLNRRKQEIRLLGSLAAICSLEQIVLNSIDEILGESKKCLPISNGDYLFLLQGGRYLMHKLISMSFVRSVSLDIKNRGMIVEGGSVDIKKIMANVHKLQRLSSAGGNGDANRDLGPTLNDQNLCPVCFCPPRMIPAVLSYCSLALIPIVRIIAFMNGSLGRGRASTRWNASLTGVRRCLP